MRLRLGYTWLHVIIAGMVLTATHIAGSRLSLIEQELSQQREGRTSLTNSSQQSPNCETLYQTLLGVSGRDLVDVLIGADYGCIRDLEHVDDEQLQFVIANETNVLNVAYAVSELAQTYDGFTVDSLVNLMQFLRVAEDIHVWCIKRGTPSGGTCGADVWESSQPWDTSPGSKVHTAIVDIGEEIYHNPHLSENNDSHADMLIELAGLIRDYRQSAAHLDFVSWWLSN